MRHVRFPKISATFEPFHPLVGAGRKQIRGTPAPGNQQPGIELAQRVQDEGTFVQPWVRERQVGVVQNQITVEQQIEIKRAWAALGGTAYTSLLLFKSEQRLHQYTRGKLRTHATGSI